MNLTNYLQIKMFFLNYEVVGGTIKEWYDKKPDNVKIKNVMKSTSEIGCFVNSLLTERQVMLKIISDLREEKAQLLKKYELLDE